MLATVPEASVSPTSKTRSEVSQYEMFYIYISGEGGGERNTHDRPARPPESVIDPVPVLERVGRRAVVVQGKGDVERGDV